MNHFEMDSNNPAGDNMDDQEREDLINTGKRYLGIIKEIRASEHFRSDYMQHIIEGIQEKVKNRLSCIEANTESPGRDILAASSTLQSTMNTGSSTKATWMEYFLETSSDWCKVPDELWLERELFIIYRNKFASVLGFKPFPVPDHCPESPEDEYLKNCDFVYGPASPTVPVKRRGSLDSESTDSKRPRTLTLPPEPFFPTMYCVGEEEDSDEDYNPFRRKCPQRKDFLHILLRNLSEVSTQSVRHEEDEEGEGGNGFPDPVQSQGLQQDSFSRGATETPTEDELTSTEFSESGEDDVSTFSIETSARSFSESETTKVGSGASESDDEEDYDSEDEVGSEELASVTFSAPELEEEEEEASVVDAQERLDMHEGQLRSMSSILEHVTTQGEQLRSTFRQEIMSLSTFVDGCIKDLSTNLQPLITASLKGHVEDSLEGPIKASLAASLEMSLKTSLKGYVESSLRPSLEAHLEAFTKDYIEQTVKPSLKASLKASLATSHEAYLKATVDASLAGINRRLTFLESCASISGDAPQ